MSLDEIIVCADGIARDSGGNNYDHSDRRLASMLASLARIVHDQQLAIDDLISIGVNNSGIDMQPAYDRLKRMIESRTEGRGSIQE